ncbi:MAG: hypothetical protein KF708_15510 [Pirellulales bacterium]|nr:hypothetical protein [Pirellulales bacterium]
MPRLLAIEWDIAEARYILAQVRGRRVALEQAGSFPLAPEAVPTESGEISLKHPSREILAAQWRETLGRQRMARPKLLLGVGRNRVELRQLVVPPVPDADLPELVRLQAMREAGFVGEDSVLDFVPLSDDPTVPRQVDAVALSADQMHELQEACSAAGWTPERMLVRPYALASGFRRLMPSAEQVVLIAELAPTTAELLVLVGTRVLVSRSVRLPQGEHGDVTGLLAEIRRTLVAVANQPGGSPVEAIYLCGRPHEHVETMQRMEHELKLPVQAFDPLAELPTTGELARHAPASTGRLGALVGMLLDEAHGNKPAIDLLDPRKMPQPLDRRLLVGLAASVIAAIVFAGGYVAWGKFSAADELNDKLAAESKKLDELVRRADAKRAAVEEIKLWADNDIVWLDELRDLSLRFPSARDAVLLRLTMARASSKGGTVEMQGLVRDPSIVGRMESNLRDKHHEVRSKRVQATIQERTYTWQFESSLAVARRDREEYRTAPAPVAGPTVPAPATTTEPAAPASDSTSAASIAGASSAATQNAAAETATSTNTSTGGRP